MQLGGIELPIFLLDENGDDSENLATGSPCIRVRLAQQPAHNEVSSSGEVCFALIDTGSAYLYADSALVRRLGCRLSPYFFGERGRDYAPAYEVSVGLAEAGFRFETEAIEADLAGQGQPYSLILGRSFLQHVQLQWNGPGRGLRLLMPGQAEIVRALSSQ